ncbi:tail assembly protein [Haemophilus parahaemolyticus]|uniref:Tail assembly protein n=2 Tax=Haemophilus parahaemolyticus TaxID=735 RepID=A0AAE6JWL9_HAEPH|nr:tail assembly protein [Haemophilus parahaemolyticus]DAS15802.1 MAG TPA: tail assembly protein [Caudoviricetes sp.]EIJ72834.1 bacteriophage lambda tail assembly protein I [Haemophilus parahaemolyticus HK385]OOR97563.1 phage tail protein [Haemophilus parahaemolyticus]QEN11741.1 tail assembly protein [Haemophilus parahaemolyticus]QRP12938.1 tail assembly protein [Haemophilus parahaemolyticus]
MIKIKFYGSLKRFGTDFQLDCQTVAEALKALMSQLKGLRHMMQKGMYKVRIGSQYLEKGLHYRLRAGMTVHFTPVLKGAKRGGVFGVIAGVALIGAAVLLGPVGGIIASQTAMMLGGMGASMLLGGVAQMLTKTPSMGSFNEQEKKSSTAFSGLQNRVAQGQAMPLAYGRILVGSLIISQGIETFDVV